MYKKTTVLLGLPLVWATAQAADYDGLVQQLQEQQQQIDEQQRVINQITHSKQAKASVTDCLPGTLPSVPRTPNYTLSYNFGFSTGALKFWREPCKVGTGSVLLVRAIPTKGSPFFCSSQLKTIQNANQSTYVNLRPSICDNIFVPSTHIIEPEFNTGFIFNPTKALTMILNTNALSSVKLNIPAGGVAPIVPGIAGSATGYKNFKFSCKNAKTGVIKSYPLQTKTAWSCKGLPVKTGNTVTTIITGIVK